MYRRREVAEGNHNHANERMLFHGKRTSVGLPQPDQCQEWLNSFMQPLNDMPFTFTCLFTQALRSSTTSYKMALMSDMHTLEGCLELVSMAVIWRTKG